ncbi:MAG: hypothetical protein K8J31_16275 [Anaerolineae bacterium]|nr:hypothetical protein [Anaerolineae bacterium]
MIAALPRNISLHREVLIRYLNIVLLVVLAGGYISYIIVGIIRQTAPYDYGLIVRGTQTFCHQPDVFQYGPAQDNYYPAPLYTSLCLPLQLAPVLLQVLWQLLPLILVIWLSRGQAVALLFLPFADHALLGQSTWLVLPLYMLAARECLDRPPRAWHGLLLPLAIIKPHVAFAAAIWLIYRWRRFPRVLAVGAVSAALIYLPAFFMRPNWLLEWLAHRRGLETWLGVASAARIPFRLGSDSMLLIGLFAVVVGLLIYSLLRWKRGRLTFYDWLLLFCLSNLLIVNYDLIILLPFVLARRRLRALVLVINLFAWLVTLNLLGHEHTYNPMGVSLLIPLILVAERLLTAPHSYTGQLQQNQIDD